MNHAHLPTQESPLSLPTQTSTAPPNGQVFSTRLGGRIRVLETWYDDPPASLQGIDVWISHQRTQPLSSGGWLYFYTLHLDLTQSTAEILAHMRKNTAREIRQAGEKDDLTCSFNPAPTLADLEAYARFYDTTPRTADQSPMDGDRLRELRAAGMVQLTAVRSADGRPLAEHCLLCHPRSGIIQLSSLASRHHQADDRAQAGAVGRANRLLFYREFLHYQELGLRIYDFNGWYAGVDDPKRLQINQFKEGFRGRILYGYDCQEPVSLRGRIYLALQAIKRRLVYPQQQRDHLRRRQKAPRLPE